MSFWTIEQSTALLIDGDPDIILEGAVLAESCPAEARERYQKMFRLLDSHIRMSGVGSNLPPTEAIEWALHAKVDPPQALVDAVRAQGRTLIEERTRRSGKTGGAPALSLVEDKPLGERERNTLLRMIIGMAIGGYGFDPDDKRSDVPATIETDLNSLGLEGTAQTIRSKLQKARNILPNDWKERKTGKAN